MFNLKHFKLVKKLNNITPKLNWLKFSAFRKKNFSRDELINSIIANNKFVEEDLKIHAMVEEMLVKEFSPEIKKMKSYDFLVDSVVNKLKQNQLSDLI